MSENALYRSGEGKAGACKHCELPIPMGESEFCCSGCRSVYRLLHSEELSRFYTLRDRTQTVNDLPDEGRSLLWVDDQVVTNDAGVRHARFDIQGIHCSACVWLIQSLFERSSETGRISVNPGLGRLELWVDEGFDIAAWVHLVERFGYRLGPPLKQKSKVGDALLLRMGICVALALNAMSLSVALYLGLRSGALFDVVRGLLFAIALLSVIVGGPVFFRSALMSLRRGEAHLDLPISLGIVLAFSGSAWAYWSGNDNALYLDSVSVFIALMLIGRYLQERLLIANQNRILASNGVDSLSVGRVGDGMSIPERISVRDIRAGDRLVIAPGEFVPVDAKLRQGSAQISRQWISGESRSFSRRVGDQLSAGSCNVGSEAIGIEAQQDFADSVLLRYLETPQHCAPKAHEVGLSRSFSRYYVFGVLALAGLGFLSWLVTTGSLTRSLEVTTALLIVTCPCAFGVATPLAHELSLSRLRSAGLFVRSGDFLHRLADTEHAAIDKTGTLTTGELELAHPDQLASLSERESHVLAQLCGGSSHPVCRSLLAALRKNLDPMAQQDELTVREHVGRGVWAKDRDGTFWRLGRASWALGQLGVEGTVFSRDHKAVASFSFHEEMRSDSAQLVRELRARGIEVSLLSGDQQQPVRAVAEELGISKEHAFAEMTPEDKEEWLRERGEGLLFLGDGINDALAAESAHTSGTPALDRPYMAARCDFYLGVRTLMPIALACDLAAKLRQVTKTNLIFALAYNAAAVGLAMGGLMKPWLAAVLMPISSILLIAHSNLAIRRDSSIVASPSTGGTAWTS